MKDAGIDNEEKALEHWILHGKREGRNCDNYDESYFKIYYNNIDINNKFLFTNINNYNNNNINDDFINEKMINCTKHFNKLIFNPMKINVNTINMLSKFFLIIDFKNGGGGTTVFINTIISHYKKYKTFLIARNYDGNIIFTINDDYELDYVFSEDEANNFLINKSVNIEKIFVNHTLGHTINFLNNLFKLNTQISIITHDFYSICKEFNPVIHKIQKSYTDNNKININKYDMIITQNEKNLLIFNEHIVDKNKKIIVTPLPDYRYPEKLIHTSNEDLVIGIFGALSVIKGQNIVKHIIEFYSNTTVKIIIFGRINIGNYKNQYIYNNVNDLNDLLMQHKPNILIEASIWPETYSLTLSLKMITNLPILYFKKTGNFVVEDRLSTYNKAFSFETINELNILAFKHKQNYFYTISSKIYFNTFWDDYFQTMKKEKIINNDALLKYNIKLYPIYFPQFHIVDENNISFYDGYTDIKNLEILTKSVKTITPNLNALGLKKITDYDLQNLNIIQNQIDIITHYGINGFAIYYYWFSLNTITNNNMVMQKVVNVFFENNVNMKKRKIFFIWANESWSNNPAFGNCNHKIENTYDEHNLDLNAENLIRYFTSDNYLKIDNKPVFLIYHPWFIKPEEIERFYIKINDICKRYFFSGIHLIINSMNGDILKYEKFYLNFNYKKTTSSYYDDSDKQIYLDYNKYINNDVQNISNKNAINTLVFDFDNRARLSKPNKLKLSTICINNNEFNKIRFINDIAEKYNKEKKSEIENILLINSWNEWGENMAIEPSEQHGFYYLNLIYNCLKISDKKS